MSKVQNPFEASAQQVTYAEPQPMAKQANPPTNGKVRNTKDAKQFQVQPQPQQFVQQPQQVADQTRAIAQGAFANVKSNLVELSACGGWGLVLSMLIKAAIPVTQNLWGFTCVCLLVGHWVVKGTAPAHSITWRRVAWALVGAAVAGFFRLTPQIAVPEQFDWFFYPQIEQAQEDS
ncbi:MAG: hypothetical protein AAGF75_04765 [Cyanobacteria bacterium P01_H01_bin.130]